MIRETKQRLVNVGKPKVEAWKENDMFLMVLKSAKSFRKDVFLTAAMFSLHQVPISRS